MNILVTGGTGFLGSSLTKQLLTADHRIAVILRPQSRRLWRLQQALPAVTVLEGDLDDMAALRAPIHSFRPDATVHLAWSGVANVARDSPDQARNIWQSVSLLNAAADAGCSTFIGIGSQAEYGPHAGVIASDAPTTPTTMYGHCKLAASRILAHAAMQRSLRFAWLRLFSCYGPGDELYWMLPNLIATLLDGRTPDLTGGEQRWDYIHVEDAARAIAAVLRTPTASGIFNLGSGQASPLRETIEFIRDTIDPSLPLGLGRVPYRPDQVMHLEADVSRLIDTTGWEPTVRLHDGLKQTVEWYREYEHLVRT